MTEKWKPTTFTMLTIAWHAMLIAYTQYDAPLTGDDRNASSLHMTEDERMHVLAAFEALPATNATDVVWARRVYAPMHIHSPALRQYRVAIEAAFPEHTVTFDVVFAGSERFVPWHIDYDSLGPFETSLASIAREDFIAVHANLAVPKQGGNLRTLDSLAVGYAHFVFGHALKCFRTLAVLTMPLTAFARTHDASLGVGNVFNNLKAHEVTACSGRVSYVVRLVRKDVKLSAAKLRDLVSGARNTRPIDEFSRLLPLIGDAQTMPVGQVPWSEA